jgi:ribosomal protein S18 acetylase RimI-like enzyme
MILVSNATARLRSKKVVDELTVRAARAQSPKFTFGHGLINIDGKEAGILFPIIKKNATAEYLEEIFYTKRPLGKTVLPKKFTYVYIDQLKLSNKYRGKGLGVPLMQAFFASFKTPTLFVLTPGTISTNVSYESLLRFYRKLGMKFVNTEDEKLAYLLRN